MKYLFAMMVAYIASYDSDLQNRDDVITGRAREFHRVICQKDHGVWQKFVTENYTKALMERRMTQKVSTPGGTTTTTDDSALALESKVKMLERLNSDFGTGKLVSVKIEGDDVAMVATTADGMTGRFKFKFETNAPYLIDAIAIEVGD